MSGEITALLRTTPGGGIEARGYNDQWQTVPRDAVAEIQRLTEENAKLRDALTTAESDFYELANQMQDEDYAGVPPNHSEPITGHYDDHHKHMVESACSCAKAARAALKGGE